MSNIINNKYIENEENWVKSISIDDTIFKGTNLLTSAIWNAYKIIKWEKEVEKFVFDGKREFYNFLWNYFIVKYKNKELRDTDKDNLKLFWRFDKFWKAEKDDFWYQIPEVDFSVDYNWNYYLMIKWTLSLDEELTDVNKWVFKSMIIDLNKFNLILDKVKNTADRVEEIL